MLKISDFITKGQAFMTKERKHEIIRIYESSIIFDTIAPNQVGGIAYE